ncbi:MAG: AMP-binding protein [Candidatus Sungbacteria bacterium]|nr:AMP-binding protein [Candidatus Sungbacteria bacterium]
MNIFSVLEKAERYFGNKVAVTEPATSAESIPIYCHISYAELHELACLFSGELKSWGVKKNDRVGVFLTNNVWYPVVNYAAWRIGAVPVLLSSAMKGDELKEYVDFLKPRVLVADENLWGEASILGGVLPIYQVEKIGVCTDYAPLQDLDPSDPALILLTSGTTGRRKGAVLTHGNVMSNINATVHHTGMTSEDVAICFLPLFHCFGQNFIMNATFNAGATLVLHPRFNPPEILKSLQDNRVSMFFHVPVGYEKLLRMNDVDSFNSVRYFFSAGAPLAPETARAWHDKFSRKIYMGYGLTESTPFATYNADVKSGYRYDSVGEPIENVEVRLVDKSGRRITQDGKRGEVIIRGPNVFKGYFRNPKATQERIRKGWLFTGDIGVLDESHLRIIDRQDDMMKVSGFAVWPKEIEDVMLRYFGDRISEIAVIGCPDQDKGEIPYAFVVRADAALTEEDVMRMSHEKLSGYSAIRRVQFVNELPKAAKGTVLKHELRKLIDLSLDLQMKKADEK